MMIQTLFILSINKVQGKTKLNVGHLVSLDSFDTRGHLFLYIIGSIVCVCLKTQ